MRWVRSSRCDTASCVEMAFEELEFVKSTRSGESNFCVEVARREPVIYVRDSKDPAGPVLTFGRSDWVAFLAGVRAGDFDLADR